mmetsp:Transcript_40664/g.111891  ORF Transcript_40664/g.111891 Transcript_40664/m.111891 type:complete len:366 (-) Transcript_40664:249-1346(-)
MSLSLWPPAFTCTQNAMKSSAVMVSVLLTSILLNISSALKWLNVPLKKCNAFSYVITWKPSTSILWNSSSHLLHTRAESLQNKGRLGNRTNCTPLEWLDSLRGAREVLENVQSTHASPFMSASISSTIVRSLYPAALTCNQKSINSSAVTAPWLFTSKRLHISSALTLLKTHLKKFTASSWVIVWLLSASILWKRLSHFFHVADESLQRNGLFGNGFTGAWQVLRPSIQSTHEEPAMISSISCTISCSLYPAARTCNQNAMNSSAVMAPLLSTSTSLNIAVALILVNWPLKNAWASFLVTALLPSISITWNKSSIFFHACAESLHEKGLFGKGRPIAVPFRRLSSLIPMTTAKCEISVSAERRGA